MLITPIRAALALRACLAAHGMAYTRDTASQYAIGWQDSTLPTGFTIRPAPRGLCWHVIISGRPHLRYRPRTDNTGVVSQFDPVAPEHLSPRIAHVFRTLFKEHPLEIVCTGWETRFDDAVHFDITSRNMPWLWKADGNNPEPLLVARGATATLLTWSVIPSPEASSNLIDALIGGMQPPFGPPLPGYQLGQDSSTPHLTREAILFIANDTLQLRPRAGHNSEGPTLDATARLEGRVGGETLIIEPTLDGIRRRGAAASPVTIAPIKTTNFWGDIIPVWPLPSRILRASPLFETSIPTLIQGHLRSTVSFFDLDEQFGPAPWPHTFR